MTETHDKRTETHACDCISRQAAIDALEKVAELFPWRVPGNRDSYDRYNEAWNDAIGRAEIEIEALPSAQPEERTETHACNLISKQDAINAICEDGTALERQGRYSLTMAERKQRDADILEALQSAQPDVPDINVGDMISRQAVLKLLSTMPPEEAVTKAMLSQSVKQMDAAQPDIVACGDCIHWICHDRRCGYWNHGVKPLDWCCHAERRTDG